jgi:acetyltransferase
MGERMMRAIMDVAHHKGLCEIDGQVLLKNAAMLRLMRRLGFTLARYADDPHFTLCSKTL